MQTLTSKILTVGQHAILRQAGQIPIGSVVWMLKSRRLQKTSTNLQINRRRFWRCRNETNCKSSSCFRRTQRNGSKQLIWMIGCWSFLIFPVWTSMWSFEQSCFKTNYTLTFRHHLEALFLLPSLSMARRLRQTKMPFNEIGWGIPASALSRYCQIEIEFRVCLFWQAAITITHELQNPAPSGIHVFLGQPACTFIINM